MTCASLFPRRAGCVSPAVVCAFDRRPRAARVLSAMARTFDRLRHEVRVQPAKARTFDRLRRAACVCALLAVVCTARAQQGMALLSVHKHLYGDTMFGDSVRVRTMLESGIPFPFIDSALVWEHPGIFRPEKLDEPRRFRMAAGFSYVCRYKLPAGLEMGGMRSLCETYVADLGGRQAQLIWPLQVFTTDSLDRAGMFGLDLCRGRLLPLREEQLSREGDGWQAFDLRLDERSGMYLVKGEVAFADGEGGTHAEMLELIADLGNATLLALFCSKSPVHEFVTETGIPVQRAESRRGVRFDILLPARITFLDRVDFGPLPVLLLTQRTRLPGDGFLGVPFFERFGVVVFDFRHERLWLPPLPSE